jgi:hypothetical protein
MLKRILHRTSLDKPLAKPERPIRLSYIHIKNANEFVESWTDGLLFLFTSH